MSNTRVGGLIAFKFFALAQMLFEAYERSAAKSFDKVSSAQSLPYGENTYKNIVKR